MGQYSFTLEWPGLPSRINQLHGRHWSRRHKEREIWERVFSFAVAKPRQPIKKAKLKLTRFSSVAPDYDGLVSSWKVIIDALVTCGIIEDDHMGVIGMPEFLWEKAPKNKGKVRIEVYEIAV